MPLVDLRQDIGAHQPDKSDVRKAAFKGVDGINRIVCTELMFEIGDLYIGAVRELLCRLEQLVPRCHARPRFQGVLRRDKPPYLVEGKPPERQPTDMQMAAMGRVE